MIYDDDDNDESYSIRHWADVPPGAVCFGHHRGVDYGPGHNNLIPFGIVTGKKLVNQVK